MCTFFRKMRKFSNRALAMLLCLLMVFSTLGNSLEALAAGDLGYSVANGVAPLGDTDMVVIVRHWRNGVEIGSKETYTITSATDSENPLTISPLKEYEDSFSNFSLAAGQDAVSINGKTATVTYNPRVHLVKIHVYYSDLEMSFPHEGKEGEHNPTEKDINDDGTYNTSEGLHTNKFAEAVYDTDEKYTEETGTRVFDVTLEAWTAGQAAVSIGLILDASASMYFVSKEENLQKIKATNSGFPTGRLLTADEINRLLCKDYTDNSALGYGDYSYFVYNATTGTEEYVPLGYWEGGSNKVANDTNHKNSRGPGYALLNNNGTYTHAILFDSDSKIYNASEAGWYYVNGESTVNDTTIWDTAKQYRGLVGNESRLEDGKANANKFITVPTWYTTNSGRTAGACDFYLDGGGYLHCIFRPSNDILDSYVYFMPDTERIKTEELQNALGNFVNKLSAVSLDNEIAVVRFSAEQFKGSSRGYKHLLMQNWTKNPAVSTAIMNLERGDGGFDGNDDGQYNYVLTGGTYTYTGLEEFETYIGTNKPENSKKYIIIFTDGIDNYIQENKGGYTGDSDTDMLAVDAADRLKKAGWTIYTVMLKGGFGIKENDPVRKYLHDISSSKDPDFNVTASTIGNNSNYSSYIKDGKSTGYNFEANDGEGLNENFSEILDNIVKDLKSYTVQDYIDPRFDLMDQDGTVIHLNAGGKITVNGKEEMVGSNGYPFTTQDGKGATLYYDGSADKQMYYVRWKNQDIPQCNNNTHNEIKTWTGTIRLQAKDDFIGGNAILTNGNVGDENMVYLEGDNTKSSGTNDASTAYNPDDKSGPSKGFPRVAVNVKVIDPDLNDESGKFYRGETPKDFLQDLFNTLDESKAEGKVYLEYLERFWERYSSSDPTISQNAINAFNAINSANGITLTKGEITSFEKFVDFIADTLDRKKSVSLPYYYLPDKTTGQTNQTGTSAHENDYIGDITFDWAPITSAEGNKDRGGLTATYKPKSASERAGANKNLVQETFDGKDVYAYGEDYVPQGKDQTDTKADDEYKPDYVWGGFNLKLVAKKTDLMWLLSEDGDWGKDGKEFTVSVTDSYGKPVGDLTILVNSSGEATLYSNTIARLSKGDYTLTFNNTPEKYGKHVNVTFSISNIDSDYTKVFDEAYDEVTGAANKKAPKDGISKDDSNHEESVKFHLGTGATSAGGNYLDQRFGVVVLEIDLDDHGQLEIKKTLSTNPILNIDEDPNIQFEFLVELSKKVDASSGTENVWEALNGTYEYKVFDKNGPVKDANGKEIKGEIANGETIKLKDGQYAVIYDLPEGTHYKVTEQRKDGFEPKDKIYIMEGDITTDPDDGLQEGEADFENHKIYTPVPVNLGGTKTWSSDSTLEHAPSLNIFKFTVTPQEKSDAVMDYAPNGGAPWEVTSGTDGKISFFGDSYKFELPGTYVYKIAEKKDTGKDGVTYSDKVYTVTIDVTEYYDAQGVYHPGWLIANVTVDPTVGNNGLEFENKFDYNAHVTLDGTKTLENGTLEDNQFTFKLTATNENWEALPSGHSTPMPASATTTNVGGIFKFGDIEYTQTGTYYYTINEVNPGDEGYYVYDTAVYKVTVTVTEVNGVLKANPVITGGPAAFTNKLLDQCNLEITKTVTGALGDLVTDFEFTVTLTPPTITNGVLNFPTEYKLSGSAANNKNPETGIGNGTTITFAKKADGTYEAKVYLKAGEKLVIEGLPVGTGYVVSEKSYKDLGYGTTAKNDNGTLTTAGATAEFVNRNPAGGVNLKKVVNTHEESDRSEDKKFTFTITITPPNGDIDFLELANVKNAFEYSITRDNKGYLRLQANGDGTYTALNASGKPFTLSHFQTLNISNLPAGTKVVIQEVSHTDFTPVYKYNNTENGTNAEITIPADNDSVPVDIEVENIRNNGDLEISKTVVPVPGETVDSTAEFEFTVYFYYTETDDQDVEKKVYLTGEYDYVIENGSVNGNAGNGKIKSGDTFKLKNNGKITIQKLPAGVTYEVVESNANGYETSVETSGGKTDSNTAKGTIMKREAADSAPVTVKYTNTKVNKFEKTSNPVSGETVKLGQEIEYTVKWRNYKNDTADVTVVDKLLKGLTYKDGTAKAYTYNKETQTYDEIKTGVTFDKNSMTWTIKGIGAKVSGKVVFTAIVNEDAFEKDEDGYIVKNTGSVAVGKDRGIETTSTEHKVPVGDLVVTKKVVPAPGEEVDPNAEFSFTVRFWQVKTDDQGKMTRVAELKGSYEFTINKGSFEKTMISSGDTFKLKAGGSITIKNLPAGVEYEVVETPLPGYAANVNDKSSNTATGTIIDGKTANGNPAKAEYTNTKIGERKKTSDPVTGETVKLGQEIKYAVEWENYKNAPATVTVIDGLVKGLTYKKDSAKAYIKTMPAAGTTKYTYKYDEKEKAYEIIGFSFDAETMTWTLEDMPAGSEGFISFIAIVNEDAFEKDADGYFVENTGNVEIDKDGSIKTNTTKHEVLVGDLVVTKKVIPAPGKTVDPDAEFAFTVRFWQVETNAQGETKRIAELLGSYEFEINNGSFGGTMISSGDTFNLKNGGSITIKNLPAGVEYEVVESNADGYETTANSKNSNTATGTIIDGKTANGNPAKAEYINTKVDKFEKTSDPVTGSTVKLGQEIVYTVKWRNYKNASATVTVTDKLLKGLTYKDNTAKAYIYDAAKGDYVEVKFTFDKSSMKWTMENIAAKAYGYVVFTAIVNEDAFEKDEDGYFVKNTGYVKIDKDGDIETNTTVHEVLVGDLIVTKTVVPAEGETVDEDAEFEFTVRFWQVKTNDQGKTTRIAELTGSYEFVIEKGSFDKAMISSGDTFKLNAGGSITIKNLPAGIEYEVEELNADGYKVSAKTSGGEAESNTAIGIIVDSKTANGNPAKVEYTNTTADEVLKSSDPEPGTMRKVGDEIEYTVTWENYKNDPARVTVMDPLIEGLTYKTGSAKAYIYELPEENDEADDDAKDADGADDTPKYTYKYDEEKKAYEIIGFSFDAASMKWTLENMPARSSGFVVFTAIVNKEAITDEFGNTVTNKAKVKVNDDTALETNEIEHPVSNPTKTEPIPGEGKLVMVGSGITYEITWENYMEENADVIITDPLDVGVEFVRAKFGAKDEDGEWYTLENEVEGITYDAENHTVIWTLEDQEAHANGRVTLVVKVIDEANIAEIVKNKASVKVGNDDPVDTNEVENPTPKTGVTIHKTQSVNGCTPTDKTLKVDSNYEVTYYLTVKNIGTIPATGVIVTDAIPEGLILVEGKISHEGTADEDGVITWDVGTLEADEEIVLSFVVTVPVLTENASWLNIAKESHDNPEYDPDDPENPDDPDDPDNPDNPDDPDDPDNPDDPDDPDGNRNRRRRRLEQFSNEVEILGGTPNIVVNKMQAVGEGRKTTAKLEVKGGDLVTYYLEVKNNGNGTAIDVVVTDEIPDNLALVSGTISNEGVLLSDGKTIVWQLGKMEPGDVITVSFQVRVPAVSVTTTWKNMALASSTDPNDPDYEEPDPDDPDYKEPDPNNPHRGRTRIKSNEVEIVETIIPPPNEEKITTPPPTGDDWNSLPWLAMFTSSFMTLLTFGFMTYRKRPRRQRR